MTLENPKIRELANGQVALSFGDDRNLFVEFELRPVYLEALSQENGQPCYEDREFITIIVPGNNKSTVVREVQHNWNGDVPPDSERWPAQYKAFKAQQLQVTEGTPLSNWPAITKAVALNLKGMNIHTVEHLADASDTIIQGIFGGAELRKLAQSYMAQAKDGKEVSRINAELMRKDNEIAALKNQIKDMNDRFAELERKIGNPLNKTVGMPVGTAPVQPVPEAPPVMGAPIRRKKAS